MTVIAHPSSASPVPPAPLAPGVRVLRMLGGTFAALGAVAILLPQAASLATELLVGLVLLVSGALGVVLTAKAPGVFSWAGTGVLAALSALAGIVLLAAPASGVQVLTIMLAGLFVLEGALYCAFGLRSRGGSAVVPGGGCAGTGWLVVNGVVSILVAATILARWPASAAWAIGLLVGLKLLGTGIALFMFGGALNALGTRRA